MYLQEEGEEEAIIWKTYIGAVDGHERIRRAFNAVRTRDVQLSPHLLHQLTQRINCPLTVHCARSVLPGKNDSYLRPFTMLYSRCVRDWRMTCNEDLCVSHKVSAVAGRTVGSIISGNDYSPYLAFWFLCTCKTPMDPRVEFFANGGNGLNYNRIGLYRLSTTKGGWGHSSNRVRWPKVDNLLEKCNSSDVAYKRVLKTFLTFVASQYFDTLDQIAFKPDSTPTLANVPGFMVNLARSKHAPLFPVNRDTVWDRGVTTPP